MSSPSHIALPGRKALLASLLAYEARARHAPGDDEGAPTKIVQEMRGGGNRAFHEIEPPPRNYPLDQWLAAVIRTAATNMRNMWGELQGSPAEAMVDELNRAAATLSCELCSPGRVCRGRAIDDAVVAASGHCMRHVFDAFEIASKLAEAYYGQYATLFHSPPLLILSTCATAGKPHDIPVPIYVGGQTEYRDHTRGPVSAVEFQVSLMDLDWHSWLCVTYVFLHECVCHGYAGIAPPHLGRVGLFQNDPFAEGWMDRVCDLILEDLAAGASPANVISERVAFRGDVCDAGRDFHRARADRARDGNKKASSVEQSARAAGYLIAVLQGIMLNPLQAREAMFRLSLDFNLLDRTVPQRSHIVTVIDRDLAGPHRGGFGTTASLIKKYLDHRDSARLFAEFLQL